jgi:hypothetical protein
MGLRQGRGTIRAEVLLGVPPSSRRRHGLGRGPLHQNEFARKAITPFEVFKADFEGALAPVLSYKQHERLKASIDGVWADILWEYEKTGGVFRSIASARHTSVGHASAMTMIASIHLPPKASSGYVRVEIDGETAGYLRANMYDQVFKDETAFREALQVPGAEEEAHSKPGHWVVRLLGEAALAALYRHLALRESSTTDSS